MSVKYGPSKLRVPLGFHDILDALAREVLREQPVDIIQFADKYFKEKLKQRETGLSTDTGSDLLVSAPSEEVPGTDQENPVADDTDKEVFIADHEPTREEVDAAIKIQSLVRGAHVRRQSLAHEEAETSKIVSSTPIKDQDADANELSIDENIETNKEEDGNVIVDDKDGNVIVDDKEITEVAEDGPVNVNDPTCKEVGELGNEEASIAVDNQEIDAVEETDVSIQDAGNIGDTETGAEALPEAESVDTSNNIDDSIEKAVEEAENVTTDKIVIDSLENESTPDGVAESEVEIGNEITGEQEETGDPP